MTPKEIRELARYYHHAADTQSTSDDNTNRRTAQALELGAAAMEREEWIPVGERLPPEHTDVLVWRKDAGVFMAAYTSCDAFMSEEEIERHHLTDDDLFSMDWFSHSLMQGNRMEGSEAPTHWRLPFPPVSDSMAQKEGAVSGGGEKVE